MAIVSSTKYPNFVSDFCNIKEEKQINQNWGIINGGRSYIWRIGENVKNNFSPHLELELPDSTIEEINNFKKMFNEGEDMMGISVSSPLTGNDSNKIRLLQMSYSTENKNINNVVNTVSIGLFNDNNIGTSVTDPINGDSIFIANRIQMGSIKLDGDLKAMDAIIISRTKGAIISENFLYGVTPTNENNGYSMFGSIDYSNGNLYLNRSGSLFEQELMNLGGQLNGEELINNDYSTLTRGNYSVSFNVYKNPVSLIWEWELPL